MTMEGVDRQSAVGVRTNDCGSRVGPVRRSARRGTRVRAYNCEGLDNLFYCAGHRSRLQCRPCWVCCTELPRCGCGANAKTVCTDETVFSGSCNERWPNGADLCPDVVIWAHCRLRLFLLCARSCPWQLIKGSRWQLSDGPGIRAGRAHDAMAQWTSIGDKTKPARTPSRPIQVGTPSTWCTVLTPQKKHL
jgi:hypothetical protein